MAEKLHFDLPAEVEACDMVVIYDRKTGAIRHTHKCFTWRGAKHPSREELEREALALARQEGVERGDVGLLHVDPRTLELEALHSVDVKRLALVTRPVPSRAERKKRSE